MLGSLEPDNVAVKIILLYVHRYIYQEKLLSENSEYKMIK